MKELGITKGEWHGISFNLSPYRIESTPGNRNVLDPSEFGAVATNNMRLIVNAARTAQKCGLLPSELLKQRDELLEALKEAWMQDSPDKMYEIIGDAITKAEER